MTDKSLFILFAAAGFLSVASARGAASVAAQAGAARHQPVPTVWSGVYSTANAERGKQAYAQLCSQCHGANMKGGTMAPGLIGSKFFDRWHDLRLGDVVAYIQAAMPREHDFYVSAQSAREIVSLMLQESGIPAGSAPMPSDFNALQEILITRPMPRK